MSTTTRPEAGVYPTVYPPATFFPCGLHPGAGALTVLVVTTDEARYDGPCCLECGGNLHRGHEEYR